jgi:hypothetical protein
VRSKVASTIAGIVLAGTIGGIPVTTAATASAAPESAQGDHVAASAHKTVAAAETNTDGADKAERLFDHHNVASSRQRFETLLFDHH